MVKQGILHDYDLHANLEPSAKLQRCVVCGHFPMQFQWSDFSGEGMCIQCGCSYQLKWGSPKHLEEGNYPYLNLQEEFIPIAKEYWETHHSFVCYGTMLGPRPGMASLVAWLQKHHPYWMLENKERKGKTEKEWNETIKEKEGGDEYFEEG